ncbi:MAG: hypothetical protein H7268_04655 [Sandarakinorhabdus sp.]|nr:hypothetical protein [Sandarakinorhabdus sp.]
MLRSPLVLSGLKLAVASSLALIAFAAPANAANTTFAQFIQSTGTKIVSYGKSGGSNTLSVVNGPVTFSTFAFGPASSGPALFNMSASSSAPVTALGQAFLQPSWNGTMSFTNGATNLLTVSFANAVFSVDDGKSSGGLASGFPPHSITFTSDILDLSLLTTKDFSLAFNGFRPLFGTGMDGLGTPFAANVTGTFAGGVPEMQSWMMMIAGFGAVGAVARNRRRSGPQVLA